MLTFQDLIDRNYATVKRRWQLSDLPLDHVDKIKEEHNELVHSLLVTDCKGFDPIEAIDVILTTCTMLKHFGYDIPKLMEEKVKFNEQRED